MASFVPNISKASCLASSVLPTPVGPTKRKLPIGRFPSSKPARLRRIALATASTALSWPITLALRRSFMPLRRSISLAPIWDTGTPVIRSTDSATSLTVAVTFISSVWFWIFFSSSSIRVLAFRAASKSSFSTAASCLSFCSAISCSTAWTSVTGCWAAKWAAVTSTRSIALSGKLLCGIYWTE